MPRYTHQCSCGLRFETTRSASRANESSKCDACGLQAPRYLASDVSLGHDFDLRAAGVNPNTGSSAVDLDFDRAIGAQAEQLWGTVKERHAYKIDVLSRRPGAAWRDLSRRADGTYDVLATQDRLAIDAKRAEAHAALRNNTSR